MYGDGDTDIADEMQVRELRDIIETNFNKLFNDCQ